MAAKPFSGDTRGLELVGVDELTKALQNVAVEIGDPKLRRKITRKAGRPIVKLAREIAPKIKDKWAVKLKSGGVGKKRYDTAKLVSGIRAPRNEGNVIAEYARGNLAASIRVLALRRAVSAIIGPFINKRGKGTGRFGPGAGRSDGYYAQMVFGSARRFQQRVMIIALQNGRGAAVASIENDLKPAIKKAGRKNGLDVR